MDIQKSRKEALKQRRNNIKYFAKLNKKTPKDLDDTMEELHEEVFANIDCLTCANCCKTTSPVFTEKDVNRIAKHFRIKPGQMVDKYLKLDEDLDYVLKGSPCVFLADDNTCDIYDVRPKACSEYPHTNRKKFHKISELNINNTLICPATHQVVERLKQVYPL